MVGCAGEVEGVGECFIASSLAEALSFGAVGTFSEVTRADDACEEPNYAAFYAALYFDAGDALSKFKKHPVSKHEKYGVREKRLITDRL